MKEVGISHNFSSFSSIVSSWLRKLYLGIPSYTISLILFEYSNTLGMRHYYIAVRFSVKSSYFRRWLTSNIWCSQFYYHTMKQLIC